ncbi:MAG: hypothetical protein R6X02_06955 [Enhygromyxa sp.]
MELIDKFLIERRRVLERCATESPNLPGVQIADLANFGTPAATVRKHLGDKAKAQDKEFTETFAGYIVVVPNAVIRGVVTALNWIIGDDGKPILYASSLKEVFSKDWTKSLGVDLRTVTYEPRD